jgi:orotidine-5'-phosphate decarboxylase
MIANKDRLILALDVADFQCAEKIITQLESEINFFQDWFRINDVG